MNQVVDMTRLRFIRKGCHVLSEVVMKLKSPTSKVQTVLIAASILGGLTVVKLISEQAAWFVAGAILGLSLTAFIILALRGE